MQLSKYFTLGDLIKSSTADSQGISNLPDEGSDLDNLTDLAKMLDQLYDNIGPFDIESGYRSQALNDALGVGAAGEASQAQVSKKSLHMQGLAADIVPTTVSATEWFAKLITSPFADQLGEMSLKLHGDDVVTGSQDATTVHLTLATDTIRKKIQKVINNQYIAMTQDEIDWMATVAKYAAPAGIGLAALVAIAIAAYVIMKKRK